MNNKDSIEERDILEFAFRECACGCGRVIKAIDSKGREVRYVCGHNRRKSKDSIKIEVSKVTDIQQAKDIIYNQAKIIQSLQLQIEWMEDGRKAEVSRWTQEHSY
jgi:hypothetical protein